MKTRFQIRKAATLIIAFFLSIQLFSQERVNLFNNTSRTEIGFTQEQSEKLDRMIANPIYLSHYFIEVNELIQVQENGSIDLNLPDKEGTELFVGKEINYVNSDEYVYYGELDPCDEFRMGYIHLIAKNGDVFGQINIEEEIYELQDFGGHKNVLFKIDPAIYTAAECGTEHLEHSNTRIELKSQQRSGEGCDVRVLVLFTGAANAIGNPHNSANLFIQQTNQIMCNSDASVSFTLAGVVELDEFVEANTAIITRDNLRTDDVVDQLRGDFEADLVVLLTDGNWLIDVGKVNGVAYLDNWGDPEYGFAVVEIDAAGGKFTFTHEVAHDFGCKHSGDNRGAPGFELDARGHTFRTGWFGWGKTRETIMAPTDEKGNARIMHFSNPDAEFKNKKTGVAAERENADQLSASGCTIADYEDSTPVLNINIAGPNKANNSGTYTWCVDIGNCGGSIASIEWEYSYNGFNYLPFTAGECFTKQMPIVEDLYLRVTVTCSDGQVDSDSHVTLNNSGIPTCDKETPRLKEEKISTKVYQHLSAFPSSTSDFFTLEFLLLDEAEVEILVVELMGKQTQLLAQETFNKGLFSEAYDISQLSSGYYFVKVQIGNEIITKSIIKP